MVTSDLNYGIICAHCEYSREPSELAKNPEDSREWCSNSQSEANFRESHEAFHSCDKWMIKTSQLIVFEWYESDDPESVDA